MFKKNSVYLVDIKDLSNPIVYNQPFGTIQAAKAARYRLFPKGAKISYIQGIVLRKMVNLETQYLPGSKHSPKELREVKHKTNISRRKKRADLKKYPQVKDIAGSLTKSQLAARLSQVLNK
jgi:hypothetical protein